MEYFINGHRVEQKGQGSFSLDAVLRLAGIVVEGRCLAVAVDSCVVRRCDWQDFLVYDGCRIEVVAPVAGG